MNEIEKGELFEDMIDRYTQNKTELNAKQFYVVF